MNFDYLIIGVYLMVTLVIGFRSANRVDTIEKFAVSDRKFSLSMISATLMATAFGAENIFSMSQRVYEVGILYIAICLAIPISLVVISKTIVPKMKPFSKAISVGDIMFRFYGKKGRIITGIAGFLLCTGYVGAQVAAIGYFCNFFLELSPFWSIIVGAGTVTAYAAMGGIRAVSRTDVIQLGVLVVAIPMLCNIALTFAGGYEGLLDSLPDSHFSLIPQDRDFSNYILLFIILAFPFLDPAIVQRMLMVTNTRQLKQSFQLTAGFYVAFCIIVGLFGLSCLVLMPNVPSNNIVPYFISNLLPSGIKGIMIAGILAVIMSTADSYLNAGSVCFSHDFIKPIVGNRINSQDELLIARCVTVLMGIGSIIAAISKQNIMDIVLMFCNFWAPVVVVPLLTGIFGYKMSDRAFICSIISGILTALLWMFYLEAKLGFDGLIPSILANAIVFFSVDRKQVVWADPFDHESLKQPLTPTEMQAAMRGE